MAVSKSIASAQFVEEAAAIIIAHCHLVLVVVLFTPYIQVSPYFDPTYTRTGWIGQPPVLDRHEVVTIDGDVVTLRQATP